MQPGYRPRIRNEHTGSEFRVAIPLQPELDHMPVARASFSAAQHKPAVRKRRVIALQHLLRDKMHRRASECPWLTPRPQNVYVEPCGKIDSARTREIENNLGSHPVEITATVPAALAAASTCAKYSGICEWLS
jgi:hypothetical protein